MALHKAYCSGNKRNYDVTRGQERNNNSDSPFYKPNGSVVRAEEAPHPKEMLGEHSALTGHMELMKKTPCNKR